MSDIRDIGCQISLTTQLTAFTEAAQNAMDEVLQNGGTYTGSKTRHTLEKADHISRNHGIA